MKLIDRQHIAYEQVFDAGNTTAQSNLRIFDFDRGALFRSNRIIVLRELNCQVLYNNKLSAPNERKAMPIEFFRLRDMPNARVRSIAANYPSGGVQVSEGQVNYYCYGNQYYPWRGYYQLPERFTIEISVNPSFAATDIRWYNLIYIDYEEYEI